MQEARKGDWVQIYKVVLPAGERAPQVPQETQQVPLEMRVKGFLVNELAKTGQQVTIRTAAGRELTGQLVAVHPRYQFDYGAPQPELLAIGPQVRKILEGSEDA